MSKKCNPNSAKASDLNYICNPLSGIWIKKDGALAKKLIKDGIINILSTSTKVPLKTKAVLKETVKQVEKPKSIVKKLTTVKTLPVVRLNDKLVEMLEELSKIEKARGGNISV